MSREPPGVRDPSGARLVEIGAKKVFIGFAADHQTLRAITAEHH